MNLSPKVRILGVLLGGDVSPFVGIKKEYVKRLLTYSFVCKVYKPYKLYELSSLYQNDTIKRICN
jgi:hypothetical protein